MCHVLSATGSVEVGSGVTHDLGATTQRHTRTHRQNMEHVLTNELLDIVRKNAFVDIDGEILVTEQGRRCAATFLKTVNTPRFVLAAASSPFGDTAVTAVVSQSIETINGNDLLSVAESTNDVLNLALLLCRLSTVSSVLILDSCPRLRQAAMGATKVVFLDIVSRVDPFEEFLAVHLLPHLSGWLGDGGEQTTCRLVSLLTTYSPFIGLCLSASAESVVNATFSRLYPSLLSFDATELRARTEQSVGFGKRLGWLNDEQLKRQQLFLVAAIAVSPSSLVTFIIPLSGQLPVAPRVAAEFEIELRRASVDYVPIPNGDCVHDARKTRHSSQKLHSKSVFKFTSIDRRSTELATMLNLAGNDVELAGFRATRRGVGVVMAMLKSTNSSEMMIDN